VLTSAEKRFIKYWEEQRTGGKIKYYLLYILAGTFIASLVISFLYTVLISVFLDWVWGEGTIVIISFVLVTFLTVMTWDKNEKRFKRIIKREIREGKMQDDKYNDEKLV
jgi:Ca2+-dependent lipid-binding protein